MNKNINWISLNAGIIKDFYIFLEVILIFTINKNNEYLCKLSHKQLTSYMEET